MRKVVLQLLVSAIAALLIVPTTALSFEQRAGERVTVSDAIDDDLYVFGTNVDITGSVTGDVIAFGQNITVTGDVSGDVMAAGQNVRVSGTVDGSVRAAGQDITVDGDVGEDAVCAGANVRVTEAGSVGRDAMLAGSAVTVAGNVGRNLRCGATRLTISAPVEGDVEADVEDLVLTSSGSVGGNLDYYADDDGRIEGQVGGRVQRFPARTNRTEGEASPAFGALFGVLGWVRGLIGALLFGLLLVLLFRRGIERSTAHLIGQPWLALALGFGLFVVAFPVAVIVFVIGLILGGWWIAIAWLAAVWLLALAGSVVASVALGRVMLTQLGRPASHTMLALVVGVLVLRVVGAIPFAGWLLELAAVWFGAGAILLAVFFPHYGVGAQAVAVSPAPYPPTEPRGAAQTTEAADVPPPRAPRPF